MAENKILGYKNIFGFVLPDWVDESLVRTIVTFLLASSAMLFVLIFLIWPKFETLNKIKKEAADKKTQLESLRSSKAGFDKLNEQIPEFSQNLILKAVPQAYSPENAIFMLRKISTEAGVSIVSYSLPSGMLYEADKPTVTEKPKDKNETMVDFVSFPIRLTVTAPVESLLSFVKKIESSLPFGVVSDLGMQEMSKLAKFKTVKDIQMEMEIRYYRAELKQVDISKITPFTDKDLSLVEDLEKFSQYSQTGNGVEMPIVNNTTESLFGF